MIISNNCPLSQPLLTHYTSVLQRVAGKDASKQFWKYHNESILKKYKGQLLVGSLDSKKQEAPPPTPPATPPPAEKKPEPKEQIKPQPESGVIAPVPGKDVEEAKESMDPYGAMIPYADPSWYQSVCIMPCLGNSWLTLSLVSLSLFQRDACHSTRRSPRMG